MKIGYIRLSKAGPSLEDQQKALAEAGVSDFSEGGPVIVDQCPVGTAGYDWPGRERAIGSLDPGDELVVSSAARLGTSVNDVLTVLRGVGERQAVVLDAATGQKIILHPDAILALEYAQRAEQESRKEVAATARAAQAATGRFGAAPKKLDGDTLAKARQLWADPSLTGEAVAKRVGVTVRTLYRRLGDRGIN